MYWILWDFEKAVKRGNMKVTIKDLGTILKNLEKQMDKLKIRERIKTIQILALVKIRHDTRKNNEYMWRLAVSQSPVKKHQFGLAWRNNNKNNK